MTTHQPISAADRTLLPRGLIERRRFVNPEYQFSFEIGRRVTLNCTSEAAIITGRMQVIGWVDEYVIELVDVDCHPHRVMEYQIHDNPPCSGPRRAPAETAKQMLLLRGENGSDLSNRPFATERGNAGAP